MVLEVWELQGLYEMGYKEDVVERTLAHSERNKVRAAYNHAQYIEERTEMMQAWSRLS